MAITVQSTERGTTMKVINDKVEKITNFAVAAICIVLLASYATAEDRPQAPSPTPIPVVTAGAETAKVRIGPGDLLEVAVFDVPDLAQQIRVDDKGDGVANLLGPIHLGGMTTAEAQAEVEKQ